MALSALVLGSGFAGKEHTQALRYCGVEVVGMAGRTQSVVRKASESLKIPHVSTDWREALNELAPDIVDVATPGGAHYEPIIDAIDRGIHIYCDKPLATDADKAREIYLRAREKDVKTAYAATFCYQYSALHAAALVKEGSIGTVQEVECFSHYNLNPLVPFAWSHRLDLGGGRLNNNFTHKLAIVLRVLGGSVLTVAGETRNDMKKVPVGAHVHDFREREKYALTSEEARKAEWRQVDSDWSYTVMAKIGDPQSDTKEAVSALFKHSGLHPGFNEDGIVFYGSAGSIYLQGAYAQGDLYFRKKDSEWEKVPLPRPIRDALPAIENNALRNWTALMEAFVGDIQGRETKAYLTFRDGWHFQQVIDAVRLSPGKWTEISRDD